MSESRLRVLIVGASVSGLTLAYQALKMGHNVDLLESLERVNATKMKFLNERTAKQNIHSLHFNNQLISSSSLPFNTTFSADSHRLNGSTGTQSENLSLSPDPLEKFLKQELNLNPNEITWSTVYTRLVTLLSKSEFGKGRSLRVMTGRKVEALLRNKANNVIGVQAKVYLNDQFISSAEYFADVVVIATRELAKLFADKLKALDSMGLLYRSLLPFNLVDEAILEGFKLSVAVNKFSISHLHLLQVSTGVSVPQRQGYYDGNNVFHQVAIQPDQWTPLKVLLNIKLTPSSNLFRILLPNPTDQLGLFTGQHIALKVKKGDGSGDLIRYYTPVTRNSQLGSFDLIIKIDHKNIHKLPYTSMQRSLSSVVAGDTLQVKGPIGGFVYHRNTFQNVGMICGGTGITPMLQIMRSVSHHPEDWTNLFLMYGASNESEILCKEELIYLASTRSNINLELVLENPPSNWKLGRGLINKSALKLFLPPPSPLNLILMCGPPGMMKSVKGHLMELGYSSDMIYNYDEPHKPPRLPLPLGLDKVSNGSQISKL